MRLAFCGREKRKNLSNPFQGPQKLEEVFLEKLDIKNHSFSDMVYLFLYSSPFCFSMFLTLF